MTEEEFMERAIRWSSIFGSILEDMQLNIEDVDGKKVFVSDDDTALLCKNFNDLLKKVADKQKGRRIQLIS